MGMGTGRRTRAEVLATDTTPGKVLAMAVLANVPIALGFVLVPIVTADRAAALAFVPFVLWIVPPLALGSLFVYVRAPKDRKAHRASRVGALLAAVSLALWALVLVGAARA